MKYLVMIGLLVAGSASFAQESEQQQQRMEEGDVLLIEKIRESGSAAVPASGLKMDQVEERFGEPVTRAPAVGDPPITRWIYDDFTVYFEHDTVIHAVVNRETVS